MYLCKLFHLRNSEQIEPQVDSLVDVGGVKERRKEKKSTEKDAEKREVV